MIHIPRCSRDMVHETVQWLYEVYVTYYSEMSFLLSKNYVMFEST